MSLATVFNNPRINQYRYLGTQKINANSERDAVSKYERKKHFEHPKNLKHITLSGMANGLLPHSAKALSQVMVARA
jgi:hypothetical protein